MNYAQIGRLCGFQSRSYFRDIIKGTKPLSSSLALKTAAVLNFDQDMREHFFKLCASDYSDCRPLVQIQGRTNKLRKTQSQPQSLELSSEYRNRDIPVVFAAIGDERNATSLASIEKRSRLGEARIQAALQQLVDHKLVSKKGRNYYINSDHILATGLGRSVDFNNYYLQCLSDTYTQARRSMNSDKELFFASHFLVKEADLPRLKKELREVLVKFVDKQALTTGDRVANLVCSLV